MPCVHHSLNLFREILLDYRPDIFNLIELHTKSHKWLKWLTMHVPCMQATLDRAWQTQDWAAVDAQNSFIFNKGTSREKRAGCWSAKLGTQNWCAFTCVISPFSLWSEREKQILMHKSGVWQNCYRQSSLHSKSRGTDMENKGKDTEGERGKMGWIGRLGLIHIHYWYCV